MNTPREIPRSMRDALARMPNDRAAALMLRHSVRDELPPGEVGYDLPITGEGRQLARAFGVLLGARLQRIHSSPLPRCVQTAEAIREGAAADLSIAHDKLLGDPGIYVEDGKLAGQTWKRYSHAEILSHQVCADKPQLPGLVHRPDVAARSLVRHMLTVAGDAPGVHLFVSHDNLIAVTAAHIFGRELGEDDLPDFLEGAFFWREGDAIRARYRENYA